MFFRETTSCVVSGIRCIMSHSNVAKFICLNRQGLVKTLIRLMACMQGMQFQNQEEGLGHIKGGGKIFKSTFILLHSLSGIFYLLVAGAFSVSGDECHDKDGLRRARVGSLLQGSSTDSFAGKSILSHEMKDPNSQPVPPALWLIYECLQSIECWLQINDTVGTLGDLFLHKESKGSWPNIACDNTSRVMSLHTPLHRALSIVFLISLIKECYDESESSHLLRSISADRSFPKYGDFFGQIFEGCNCDPCGFSAYVMEHPLRTRVFSAEVRAGMWREGGDIPTFLMKGYRSVHRYAMVDCMAHLANLGWSILYCFFTSHGHPRSPLIMPPHLNFLLFLHAGAD